MMKQRKKTTEPNLVITPYTIWFTSKSREWNWLSNFSEHDFELDGYRWMSVEHFYQVQKYVGEPAYHVVRQALTPLKARKAGQNRGLTVREDWEEVKEVVMSRAIREKFLQNRLLKKRLRQTEDRVLIHQSNSDLIWGANPAGEGRNLLGELLMELRKEFQKSSH